MGFNSKVRVSVTAVFAEVKAFSLFFRCHSQPHGPINDFEYDKAAMCSHVPDKGEQMVRYHGYYSNAARGKQKKANTDDLIPEVLEPELTSKAFRKNWARLIQKIPRCKGSMRVISFIEKEQVIKKILKHVGLWDVKRKLPPRANTPPSQLSVSDNHPPSPCADDYMIDPDYPVEAYFQ